MNNHINRLNVREINEVDWHLLKTTRLNALKDSPSTFSVTYLEASQYSELEWRERASGFKNTYFIAFSGTDPIGIVGGKLSSLFEYILIGMWVDPDFRGRGASDMLITHFKSFAVNKGCKDISLSVSPNNKQAINLYTRHGFVFLSAWESLPNDPDGRAQKMHWKFDK